MDVKYYAGLFDADGSFGIQARKLANGNFKIQPKAAIKQVDFRAKPLRDLNEEFKGTSFVETFEDKSWNATFNLVYTCSKAKNLMEKLKNHLVLKKEVVEFILEVSDQEVNQVVLKTIKGLLKQLRYEIHPLNKNFPSRRWMAGYIDGDGCIRVQLRSNGGISIKLEITSYNRDTQGVDLLKKAFGGCIIKHGANAIRWVKHLNESNAQKVLGYFSNHAKIKRTQVLYVLEYLNQGKHLKKRGATLETNKVFKETLQNLKQPQRLNEKSR